MNTTSSHAEQTRPSGPRALVLGGGGSAGNAWLIGVVAGLFEAGVDVTAADMIVVGRGDRCCSDHGGQSH